MKQRLLFFILIFASLLSLANYFGEEFGLYQSTIWYDVICHTLGGMVVAGIFIYFVQRGKALGNAHVVIFSLIVGVMWEFYELYTGFMHISDSGYYLDTAKDLCVDVFGAYIMCKINKRFYVR